MTPERPNTGEPFLQLRRVTKAYGGATALDNLDLEVHTGELLALVGPSGSGKTTALRVIAGLDKPGAGEVLFQGRDHTRAAPGEHDLAMVFQDFALYPHLSVWNNIAFGLRARGISGAELNSRVKEVTSALDLPDKLDRLPHELSGGEQQRVAIARALARRPALLLMDEPVANLDPALRLLFRADLARLRARYPLTILYVTHDQAEAMAIGDRVAVMLRGALVQAGSPAEIYSRPASLFVATFFGAPPMNIVPGRILRQPATFVFEDDRAASEASRIRLEIPNLVSGLALADDQPVLLGIRPEHISLSPESGALQPWRVESVQFAGHEFHITVRYSQSLSLLARVSVASKQIPIIGQSVRVSLNAHHAILFGPSGQALHTRAS